MSVRCSFVTEIQMDGAYVNIALSMDDIAIAVDEQISRIEESGEAVLGIFVELPGIAYSDSVSGVSDTTTEEDFEDVVTRVRVRAENIVMMGETVFSNEDAVLDIATAIKKAKKDPGLADLFPVVVN